MRIAVAALDQVADDRSALHLSYNKWQQPHRWHPHQLQHNAGTYIRRELGLDVAA